MQERQNYARPSAPKGYHEVSFDDFILFTRTVKRVARAMCQVGQPRDTGIVQLVERLDKQKGSEVDLTAVFISIDPVVGSRSVRTILPHLRA